MFGPLHYVPVLKCKGGEKQALAQLPAHVRSFVTPLVEVVELTDKPLADHLTASLKQMNMAWPVSRPYFLDPREVAELGSQAVAETLRQFALNGQAFIPVIGLGRPTPEMAPALQYAHHGLAIRVLRRELESVGFERRLDALVRSTPRAKEDIDLLVDFGSIESMVLEGVEAMYEALLATIPDQARWRTLTVIATAFPRSMGVVERHSDLLVERIEWQAWLRLHAHRTELERLPAFGDAAIQHPEGVEGFDPKIMKASPTIRYTTGDRWKLVKGESSGNAIPSQQFPLLAARLCQGPEYRGAQHCQGCADIEASAAGYPRLGAPLTWRRIGTVHHITTVVEQLCSLRVP